MGNDCQEKADLTVRLEEMKEELAEAKRNSGKYLDQLLDEKKEEEEKRRRLFTEEEVEVVKQVAKVEQDNAVKAVEYVHQKEKGGF